MKKQKFIALTLFVTLIMIWSSCKKTPPSPIPLPGNEPLTTMIITATNAANSADVQTAKWMQLDPTGAAAPDTSLAILNLKKNAIYNVTIQFIDSATDITFEIHDRQNYHLICFELTSGLNLTVTRTDHDNNNPPLEVGLTDKFTTTGISNGRMDVTLHHQPNVKNGDCAPGSIDMDCTFTVNIIN